MTKFSLAEEVTRKKNQASSHVDEKFHAVSERSSSWCDIDSYWELTPGNRTTSFMLLLSLSLLPVNSVELCSAIHSLCNSTDKSNKNETNKEASKNLSSLLPGHKMENLNAKIKHTLTNRKCIKRFTIETLFILRLQLFERLEFLNRTSRASD